MLGVHSVEVQPGVGEQHGGVVDGVQGLGDASRELGVQAGKQGACKYVLINKKCAKMLWRIRHKTTK